MNSWLSREQEKIENATNKIETAKKDAEGLFNQFYTFIF